MASDQVQMYHLSKPEQTDNKGKSMFNDYSFKDFLLCRKCYTSSTCW